MASLTLQVLSASSLSKPVAYVARSCMTSSRICTASQLRQMPVCFPHSILLKFIAEPQRRKLVELELINERRTVRSVTEISKKKQAQDGVYP